MAHIHLKSFQANSLIEVEELVNEWFRENQHIRLKDIISAFMNVQSALIYTYWLLYEH